MVAYFSVFKQSSTFSDIEVKSVLLYMFNAFSIPGIFATASSTDVRLPVDSNSPYSSRSVSKIGSLIKISSLSILVRTPSYNIYKLLSDFVSFTSPTSSIIFPGSSSLQYYPTMGTTTKMTSSSAKTTARKTPEIIPVINHFKLPASFSSPYPEDARNISITRSL